jgi:hypothetical protein
MHDKNEIRCRTEARSMIGMESMLFENAIRFQAEAKAQQEWNQALNQVSCEMSESYKRGVQSMLELGCILEQMNHCI